MTARAALLEFYNLDNNRANGPVEREIRALLSLEPLVLGMCETTGNRLPPIRGYDRILDRSTRSRANLAAYVREGHRISNVRWHDLEGTWPRTQGPGRHEPRSILEFRVDELQTVIAHQPPKNARPVEPLQMEGIRALDRIMAPWNRGGWDRRRRRAKVRALERPRIVLADFNRRADEPGPGPRTLAKRIGGVVASKRIDVDGLPLELMSDHRHAMLARISWHWTHGATR